jgi:hypothetical protein
MRRIQLIDRGFVSTLTTYDADWWFPTNQFIDLVESQSMAPNAYSVKSIEWDRSIASHPQAFVVEPPEVYLFYSFLGTYYTPEDIKRKNDLPRFSAYHTLHKTSRDSYQIVAHVASTHGLLIPEAPKETQTKLVEILNLREAYGHIARVRYELPEGMISEPLNHNRLLWLLYKENYKVISEKEAFALKLKYGY